MARGLDPLARFGPVVGLAPLPDSANTAPADTTGVAPADSIEQWSGPTGAATLADPSTNPGGNYQKLGFLPGVGAGIGSFLGGAPPGIPKWNPAAVGFAGAGAAGGEILRQVGTTAMDALGGGDFSDLPGGGSSTSELLKAQGIQGALGAGGELIGQQAIRGVSSAGEQLMQRALNPRPEQLLRAPTMVADALREGIVAAKGSYTKAMSLAKEYSQELATRLPYIAQAAGKHSFTASELTGPLLKRVQALERTRLPADLLRARAIRAEADKFLANWSGPELAIKHSRFGVGGRGTDVAVREGMKVHQIPIDIANEIKQHSGDIADRLLFQRTAKAVTGAPVSAGAREEAYNLIRQGSKDQLEKLSPEVKVLNSKIQGMHAVAKTILHRPGSGIGEVVARHAIGGAVGAAAGGALTPDHRAGAAAGAIAGSVLGSPSTLSRAALLLANPAIARIIQGSPGLLQALAGGALTQPQQ